MILRLTFFPQIWPPLTQKFVRRNGAREEEDETHEARGVCGGAVGSEGPSRLRIKQSCERTANQAIASIPLFPTRLLFSSTLYICSQQRLLSPPGVPPLLCPSLASSLFIHALSNFLCLFSGSSSCSLDIGG